MNKPIHLSALLTGLFAEFESGGVSYLVLRNYEELPESTTNDVDLLINPLELNQAVRCLKKVAFDTGWMLHNVGEFSCWTFHLYHQETLAQVHIDFMCGLKWHSFLFADHQSMFRERRRFKCFYIPSQEHEAATNLLTRLLYSGSVREKYRDGIAEAGMQVAEKLFGVLSPWIGSKLAREFVEASNKREWKRIERATNTARAHVIIANLRKPLSFVIRILSDVCRLIRRVVDSPGLSLVLVGGDDVKTACVARGIAKALPETFSPERIRHLCWAPEQTGEQGGRDASCVREPRCHNVMSSLMIFIFWLVKFNYKWLRQVKPVVFKNGFVVLERYGYGLFLNPFRYGLNVPDKISRFCMHLIPKPDLVVYIEASEIGSKDDGREDALVRCAIEKLWNGHVVDPSQETEDIVAEVRLVVLRHMAMRTKRRLKRFKEGKI